jgi:hypothetical protein
MGAANLRRPLAPGYCPDGEVPRAVKGGFPAPLSADPVGLADPLTLGIKVRTVLEAAPAAGARRARRPAA